MINTIDRRALIRAAPVTSLHFWVINTAESADGFRMVPVTSLHFWVINTVLHFLSLLVHLSLAYISG